MVVTYVHREIRREFEPIRGGRYVGGMEPIDRLSDLYTFPDFVPATHCVIDDEASSVRMTMRDEGRPQKVFAGLAARPAGRFTAFARATCGIFRRAAITSRWWFRCDGCTVAGAA